MLDAFLLIFFSVFVFITFYFIIKRNILFGLFYIFLYVYCIFSQIGYCFFPEISEVLLQAYFGKVVFYKFYIFNFLSFISFFCCFKFLHPFLLKKLSNYRLTKIKSRSLPIIGVVGISIYFLLLIALFLKLFNSLTYDNIADEEFAKTLGVDFSIFIFLFKTLATLTASMYFLIRLKNKTNLTKVSNSILYFLFITAISLLLTITLKVGSRTDLLAFCLAVVVFEIQMGVTKKKILAFSVFLVLAASLFNYIESVRKNEAGRDLGFSPIETIIAKDYYAPAHVLFAAIEYHYIHPVQVLSSNFCNSLVKLKYPYLQYFVMELFMPGRASRSASIAFYVFSEGFMAIGFLGFIYNGIVLNFLLSLWNRIASSEKKEINIVIVALFATQLANLARSQTSYFIKDLYIIFLPVFLFLFCFTGYIFKVGRSNLSGNSNNQL
jgi:hypothetical protein